jgi:DNA-binding NarL/FixJ family response regulator
MHPAHPEARPLDRGGHAHRASEQREDLPSDLRRRVGLPAQVRVAGRHLQGIENVLDGGGAMDAHIARRVLEMFARMVTPQADYGLSERERQILQHLVDGLTKNAIAERLELSPHTIDGHVRNIYMKLHVNNRSDAVAKALKEHLL